MPDDQHTPAGTIGVDVGGTFTDVVRWDGERLSVAKTSSTPDQADGVIDGAHRLAGDDRLLLHGTTVATNALLQRRGARTALVADAGFEDLLEIGRQDRPSLYDSFADRPEPLVDRELRFGFNRGDDVGELAETIERAGVEAVAISLLDAWSDPRDEQRLAEALSAQLDVAVCASNDVVGEFREFERTSTTVLNAYLTPELRRYLTSLRERARAAGLPRELEVLRSSGGLMPLEEAARLPAAALLSGPAGGVVAAAALGEALGLGTLVSFDMGGTSSDVCRIDGGRPQVGYERSIDGYACRMPTVAIETVGAGGGSIVWVDPGGAMRVGPSSAGAWPGPACYGRGGEQPTVTDANLVLGRIDPATSLVGEVALDLDAARAALRDVGRRVGLDELSAALGAIDVVETHMARTIRVVSVEQGVDPRDAHLVSFGGAGGLHATALARELGMRGVLVPTNAGVFSAVGLLLSPRRADRTRGVLLRDDADALTRTARELVADVVDAHVRILLDVRYVGQAHETNVDFRPGESWTILRQRFDAAHRQRNGFALDDDIEVVAVRAELTRPAAVSFDRIAGFVPSGEPERGEREVVTASGSERARILWRPGLEPGASIEGPAVIEEPEATVWVGHAERATVDETGTLEITW